MLFTILYSSKLLYGNKNRNTYIYIIGAIIYAAIHWLLYSPICNSINFVSKYKKLFYVLVASDIIYVGRKFYESVGINNTMNKQHNTSPIIEQVCDTNKMCCNKICVNEPQKNNTIIENHHTEKENNKNDIENTNADKNKDVEDKNRLIHKEEVNDDVNNDVNVNIEETQSQQTIPIYTPKDKDNEQIKEENKKE